jgi:orotate phosphoribosyltransferase
MPTITHTQQLLSLLARTSFKLGQFKLSSGGTSDYYIDCRTTTLHAEGGRLTGHAILELLEGNKIDAEAVGGLTMGADPIVSNVATASAWRAQWHPNAPLLHGFLVRKAEKAHGTGRRIEGFYREGARVVIVDDVCTTGASTIAAIEAAQEAGMIVVAVVCIVEREEAAGRPAVEAAANARPLSDASFWQAQKHVPFLRLFTANDVRAEHVKQLSATSP